MSAKFDAIIFDCDGVLVDSEILGLDASTAYLQEHGFDWTAADLVKLFTGFRDDVFAEKLNAAYYEIHQKNPGEAFFSGLIETRRARRHLLQTVPGAEKAISQIGIKKAIASSSRTEFLEGKLKRTGLYDLFAPHIYSADKVKHGKPAPDIFDFAAEKIKTPPAMCLVIEDSENGVKAARAAGMDVWGFVGGGHCFPGHDERLVAAGATRIIDDFTALTLALSSP
ncbi:MAG: HAD-IA family hydrolase [Marinicaulis sp.]|nr:HAD-IA family hydrolase [Marinicaulis sp.]